MKLFGERMAISKAIQKIKKIKDSLKEGECLRMLTNPYNPHVISIDILSEEFHDDEFGRRTNKLAENIGYAEYLTDNTENKLLELADKTTSGRYW